MSLWRRPTSAELESFDSFVTDQGALLARLARSLTSTQADSEDLLQESLAKILENWQRVAGAESSYAYARRIMVTTRTGMWRRHRRELPGALEREAPREARSGGPPWGSTADDGGLAVADDRALIRQLLQRLPPRQRAVVTLRYLEDLPDEEIAALLGISAVTVRTTAMRAVRALKQAVPSLSLSR